MLYMTLVVLGMILFRIAGSLLYFLVRFFQLLELKKAQKNKETNQYQIRMKNLPTSNE